MAGSGFGFWLGFGFGWIWLDFIVILNGFGLDLAGFQLPLGF